MNFLYKDFVNMQDVINLKAYQYSHTGYTKLDNLLSPCWGSLAGFLPRNLAPNLITLFACVSIIIPTLTFIIYDPSMEKNYPSIFYLVAAIGVFLYQTLDALDGKQARRINLSSPLGQ